jgi:hypothetical protein
MSSMNAIWEPRTFHPIYAVSCLLDNFPGRSIVDAKHVIRNFLDSVIDNIRDPHKLRRGHSSLLLRQPVQSL